MAADILVIEQIDEGRMLIDQIIGKGIGVVVAFWIKKSQEKPWAFYLACDLPGQDFSLDVHAQTMRELRSIAESWIWPAKYNIIGKDDPITVSALYYQRLFAGRPPACRRIPNLGSLWIDEAYIYPPPKAQKVWPKLTFSVTYDRIGDANHWRATTDRGELYRDLKANGVVSYSNSRWANDPEDDDRQSTVSVLLEINPDHDNRETWGHPGFDRMTKAQANVIADREFRWRHPGAIIDHEDRIDDVPGTMDVTVQALEAQAHPA